jgi:hypothetical protein
VRDCAGLFIDRSNLGRRLGRHRPKDFAIRDHVRGHGCQDHDERNPHTPILVILPAGLVLVLMVRVVARVMAWMVVPVLIHERELFRGK